MNRLSQKILNVLIDKYEGSSFFKDDKVPTRKIMLRFYDNGKNDFPDYDVENSEQRIVINQIVEEMSVKQLVFFDWMKGQENHFVSKVWLNFPNIAAAYQFCGRKPKNDIVDKVCDEITIAKENVKSLWAKNFLQDVHDNITRKRSLVSILPSDDKERTYLLKSILEIDKNDRNDFTERVFSLKTLGDSKIFEKIVKNRLLRILRKYLDNDIDVSDADLLKQIGIVRYPEQFEFCGNVAISFDSGIVDFSHLPSGSTVFSTDLPLGSLIIDSSVETVLTIENRANYIDYVKNTRKPSELIIYHGGQYSPRKRTFFKEVEKAMPFNCKWYHWGDIDYGGFVMLSRLRREISPAIDSYRMGFDELQRYITFTQTINSSYADKLKKLGTHSELADCHDCIDFMINNMVRLEQEAML